VLMVRNINFKTGEKSDVADIFDIYQFKEITLFHDFMNDMKPYIYIYMCVYKYIYIYTHTHTHTYIHTYIYIYIYINLFRFHHNFKRLVSIFKML
jgi:hypothetical protein